MDAWVPLLVIASLAGVSREATAALILDSALNRMIG